MLVCNNFAVISLKYSILPTVLHIALYSDIIILLFIIYIIICRGIGYTPIFKTKACRKLVDISVYFIRLTTVTKDLLRNDATPTL